MVRSNPLTKNMTLKLHLGLMSNRMMSLKIGSRKCSKSQSQMSFRTLISTWATLHLWSANRSRGMSKCSLCLAPVSRHQSSRQRVLKNSKGLCRGGQTKRHFTWLIMTKIFRVRSLINRMLKLIASRTLKRLIKITIRAKISTAKRTLWPLKISKRVMTKDITNLSFSNNLKIKSPSLLIMRKNSWLISSSSLFNLLQTNWTSLSPTLSTRSSHSTIL